MIQAEGGSTGGGIRSIDSRAIAFDGVRFMNWEADGGEGTPAVAGDSPPYRWLWFGANCPVRTPEAVARLLRDTSSLRSFPESWALFAQDSRTGKTIVAADRLGTQPIFYRVERGVSFWSTNLMWLLRATGHDGAYDPGGLADHLGFGHAIEPGRQVYAGVSRLPAGAFAEIASGQTRISHYWSQPEIGLSGDFDPHEAVAVLRAAGRTPERASVFGLTAGKDSLCLAAASEPAEGFTFGTRDSDDSRQGAMVAAALRWPYRSAGLCPAERFEHWAEWIAAHSGGLTTAAYVDKLDAVAFCVPRGAAFVMGCGAGCVRNSWPGPYTWETGDSAVAGIRERYTTPRELMDRTLRSGFLPAEPYPDELLERAGLTGGHPALAVKRFYRGVRMPGNFSQRHSILAPLRTKLAPLCHSAFIDRTYHLTPEWYENVSVHRAVISAAQPELLPFFDQPVRGGASSQDLSARTQGELRGVLCDLIEDCLPDAPPCWDGEGILGLLNERTPSPRAPYYLLRVVSLLAAARMRARGPFPRGYPVSAIENRRSS